MISNVDQKEQVFNTILEIIIKHSYFSSEHEVFILDSEMVKNICESIYNYFDLKTFLEIELRAIVSDPHTNVAGRLKAIEQLKAFIKEDSESEAVQDLPQSIKDFLTNTNIINGD